MTLTSASSFDSIKCPNCGERIPITKTLHDQLAEQARSELKKGMLEQQKALTAREKALKDREDEVANCEKNVEKQLQDRLRKEREKLLGEAAKKARAELELELKDRDGQIAEKDRQLKQAHDEELRLRKEKRQLEEDKKTFELQINRRLDGEREAIREGATKAVIEDHHLKDLEKDKKLQDALKETEELRRKLQQGSQQGQGDVLEIELEAFLKSNFPYDDVQPVPKGQRGADVLQRVHNRVGQYCGAVIWEAKHTKNWSEGWIEKLKDDQREAKADVAVLVSEALPKEVKGFALREGVWVTDFSLIAPLCVALRTSLTDVAMTRLAAIGKNEKIEVLFGYITGPEFKQRVEVILRTFTWMKGDLDEEKRVFTKRWAKREKQLERVIMNMGGMYGDLQGLIGSQLENIPALEAGDEQNDIGIAPPTSDEGPESEDI